MPETTPENATIKLERFVQYVADFAEAYRTGGGVPWSRYGADARDGLVQGVGDAAIDA